MVKKITEINPVENKIANRQKKKVRARILISGRVQGVFFRHHTKKKAEALDVFGWVRNLEDGRVEAVIEGEKEKVENLIQWAKKGPFLAKVNNLQTEWQPYQSEFKNFEIKK